MTRGLLYEMAVWSESDVFKMNPVVSVSTDVTNNLEGEELRKYVFQYYQTVEIPSKYKIDEHIVGELISHHCGHRKMKKAALLSLPYVINANLVTAPWRRRLGDDGQPVRKNDKRPSGMISAPILIDGVKCLCSLTLRISKGIITPYSLALKDENGEIIEGEKMEGTISSVPHSSSEPTTIGDAHSVKATTSHDTNPSFQGAKVQQNIETNQNNGIKKEHYMYNKKLIRLTEGDLHRIVKESVHRILKEGYYDFDDDFNADDVECPYCGSNNVEPISAIDTHYRCLDCGEEFYLDGGWEPDWGAMRHESHKRKGKNINEATTPTWKRWQGYTLDQKAERLAYMQQQIAQLKQQREYAKQKAKTARTPEEQQTWRNTKAQIDRELLRVVSHEHDLRVGKKMTQGAKERATIKRREDRAKAKNRITFQPQDDPYYVSESKIHRMYTVLDGQHFVTVNSAQRPERFDVTIDSVKPYVSIGGWEGYGNEAMQTINDIYSYYKQCGDVKRAISEYINNF